MTYKQALYFIGACLTLTHRPERINGIRQQIRSGKINWETLVKVSTGHMVLPAFYLNLKRANLLSFLPQDLTDYCAELTRLNRERNTAICQQAKDISLLLSKQHIRPVFLKGTAYLLEGLYQDIGERMVGDIDFLVAPNQVEQVANILLGAGYKSLAKYHKAEQKLSKHYPRLVHETRIAAVEIHKAVIQPPHQQELTHQIMTGNSKQPIDSFFVPSYAHQAIHNIMNVQINDKGFLYGKVMMRQMYDGYLLSFKRGVLEACKNYKPDFYAKNLYLKLMQHIFKAEHLIFEDSLLIDILMFRYDLSINYPKMSRFINGMIYFSIRFYHYPKTIIQACYKKEVRLYIFRRISDPHWYGKHLRSYRKQT